MITREEALRFMKNSRRTEPTPEITDRAGKMRRLGLKSDARSIAETLRVAALYKPDAARES